MPRRRKARRQLGQNVRGTTYDDRTDPRVIDILEAARSGPDFAIRSSDVARGERLCIRYGYRDDADGPVGLDWGDPPMCGVVGRSGGTPGRDYDNKIPLLIKNKRSGGGDRILDYRIVRITRGAKPKQKHGVKYVLYEHPKYHDPEGDKRAAVEAIAKDADKESRAARRDRDYAKADALKKKAAEIRRQHSLGRRRKARR